jgi:Kelch motif/Galactose oxidase, central domain
MLTAARSVFATMASVLVISLNATVAVSAASNPWSPAAPMAQPHQAAAATVLANGKVLVVGSFSQPGNGAELYDPSTDSWSATGPMIVPRGLATATLLASGKVLVAGGIAADTGHSTTRVEIYDPATNAWSPAAGMSVPRSSHTATLLQSGKVLVAGGQNLSGYIATAELYDPSSDGWTPAATMDAGYALSYATLLASGKVLITGGATLGDGRAELYDPAANRWTNAGTAGRIAETATRLGDGRVLITGQGGEAYLYDPAVNRWSVAASMLQNRMDPSATLLSDGRVLIAGGTAIIDGDQAWLTSAEIYDAVANRWSPAGCMAQARWEQTATLLPTKKVLIAGGDAPSVVLSNAELFDPANVVSSPPVQTCSTQRPNQSTTVAPGQTAPTIVATAAPVSSVVAPVASGASTASPVHLPASSGLKALQLSNPMFAGTLLAIVLLVLAAASFLAVRWRRRRV